MVRRMTNRTYILRKNATIILGLTMLLFGFQNCSPYKSLSAKLDASSSVTSPHFTPPVQVFMANGHVARTVMSCDDGLTWINDRSDNDATRCWVTGDPNYLECDHTPTSGHGVDAGYGYFYANFGWGYNGSIRRTRDGLNWTTLRTDGWGGGVATWNGVVTLLWGLWTTSSDFGTTWANVASSPTAIVYDHPDLVRANNLLFSTSRASGVAISRDGGLTWEIPASLPSKAGGLYAMGNGLIVSAGYDPQTSGMPYLGYTGVSSDNGLTWTFQQMYSGSGQTWDGLAFNGTNFIAWSNMQAYQSSDGVTWTATPVVSNPRLSAPIAFNPTTGTYVAISQGWGGYYAAQKALRSKDGINWTVLDSSHFTGGHPLSMITLGYMDATEACPATH